MKFLRENIRGKNVATFDSPNSQWVIKIPTIFSFIKQPEAALNTIYSLAVISDDDNVKKIFVDHSDVTEMDMGASAVFDVVAMNLRKEHRGQYAFSGRLPNNPIISEFIRSMGITKHLNIQGQVPSQFTQEMYVCFPLYSGYGALGSQLSGVQDRERAVSGLVKYIDECLTKASNFGLTDQGQNRICKWAGELITNAEEHSGHRQWYAIGCMKPLPSVDKARKPSESVTLVGECQLAIFGFGDSIYESLSSPKTPAGTRNQISDLVAKHTGFFNSFEKYSGMDLWTLYALQDGVSRISPTAGQLSRGKGTVEMIEAFHGFKSLDATYNPEMSLISGSTSIYFNDQYHLREQPVEGGMRKIIAFNKNNSLEEKPDSRHVHSLDGHFPGTLLTFKFFVDSRYLEKVHSSSEP